MKKIKFYSNNTSRSKTLLSYILNNKFTSKNYAKIYSVLTPSLHTLLFE